MHPIYPKLIIISEVTNILIQCIFLKPHSLTKKKEGLVNYDIIKKGRFWLFAFALECELPYLEFSKAKEHQHL
jgi:hypothetical protein